MTTTARSKTDTKTRTRVRPRALTRIVNKTETRVVAQNPPEPELWLEIKLLPKPKRYPGPQAQPSQYPDSQPEPKPDIELQTKPKIKT